MKNLTVNHLPRFALPFLIWLAATCSPTSAYNPDSLIVFRYTAPFRMALMLPWNGPEGSFSNPARLAEADRGYAWIAQENGGTVTTFLAQGGFGLWHRIYLGGGRFSTRGTVTGTGAVFLETMDRYQIAFRQGIGGDQGIRLSLGYAMLYHGVNSYGYIREESMRHEFSLLVASAPRPRMPGFRIGLSLRDITPVETQVEINQVSGSTHFERFRLYQWNSNALASLTTPDGRGSAYVDLYAYGRNPNPYSMAGPSPDEWGTKGFQVNATRYGLEYHPWTFAAFRLERIWNRYWAVGATLKKISGRQYYALDGTFTRGDYLEYYHPDGNGLISSFSLRVGF